MVPKIFTSGLPNPVQYRVGHAFSIRPCHSSSLRERSGVWRGGAHSTHGLEQLGLFRFDGYRGRV
jgi:hypothetical protein